MLYFHIHPRLFNARNVHLIAAIGMIVAAFCYYVQAVMTGTIARLILRRTDIPKLKPMAEYHLGRRPKPPAYDDYNPLQRAAYTGLLFVLFPLLILSGLAIWPHTPFMHTLAALFGGRSAEIWHLVFALSLAGFAVGHIVMVAATGLINNVRSMITGWYQTHAC